jgi:hypothetical protein
MANIFKRVQTNGKNFRAQLVRTDTRNMLWVAEDNEEIYLIRFDRILSADVFKISSEEDVCKAIFLTFLEDEDDEEYESWDCGSFTSADALDFLKWFQASLNAQQPVINA